MLKKSRAAIFHSDKMGIASLSKIATARRDFENFSSIINALKVNPGTAVLASARPCKGNISL